MRPMLCFYFTQPEADRVMGVGGLGGETVSSHSILYFSISWTSAMDSRRSSVNFLRSWGLGALKLISTLMSAPGIADVSLIPFG